MRNRGLIVVAGVAIGVALVMVAVGVAGRGGGGSGSTAKAPPVTATSVEDIRRRLGLAEPTATPDTSGAVSPQAAAKLLADVSPAFGTVLDTVAAGDVDAFLNLLDWTTAACGTRRDTYCPGVAAGQQQPVINIGADTFLVTAEGLRPSLDLLLKGTPLSLTYVAQATDAPSRYYVGFESATPKGRGLLPVTDSDLELTGVLLTLDANAKYPIVAVNLGVNRLSPAIDQAGQLGFATQRIITAVSPAPVVPTPTP